MSDIKKYQCKKCGVHTFAKIKPNVINMAMVNNMFSKCTRELLRSEDLGEECERLRILCLKLDDRIKEKYYEFLKNEEYQAAQFLEEIIHKLSGWRGVDANES